MSDKVLKRRPSLRDFEVFKDTDTKEQAAKVLKDTINWRQYSESKFFDETELGLLLDYDKQPAEQQGNVLAESGPKLVGVLIKALTNIVSENTVQYLLALIDQMLSVDPSRAEYFHALIQTDINPYAPFLRILNRQMEQQFSVTLATHILSFLLSWPHVDSNTPEVAEFFQWLITRAETGKSNEIMQIALAIKQMLRNRGHHVIFAREGGVKLFSNLLRKEASNNQLVYQIGFSLWLLSFNSEMHQILHDNDIVGKLIEVLQAVLREKVVRIIFSFFRNVLEAPQFKETMIVGGLLKLMPTLQARKWNDKDLMDDIEAVDGVLQQFVKQLSSFDKYTAELDTNALHWTPVHNEKFWRQNISRFEDNNFAVIKKLITLLDSQDDLTVEVALYDIGEFARFHFDGKNVVQRNGGKSQMLKLMSHKNPKVAKMALLSTQKLMVHNWDSLSGGTTASQA